MPAEAWDFTDAWVLASIGVYQRRCMLLEVIAAGDWMNHAVLQHDELEEALARLAGADLVRIFDDWTFELTDEGATMFSAESRSIQKQLDLIEAELAQRPVVRAPLRLPSREVERALSAYRDHSTP